MHAWTSSFSEVLKRQEAFQSTGFETPPMTPEYLAFNNAPAILAITGSFFAAATLVVILRCYVRIAMLRVFGVDDYVIVLATVSAEYPKNAQVLKLLGYFSSMFCQC
jgi:hypothetical protein